MNRKAAVDVCLQTFMCGVGHQDGDTDKQSIHQNGRFYSIPPSVATMYLDNEGVAPSIAKLKYIAELVSRSDF